MFNKIEIRRHTYSNKTAILHIDRIEEFKRKLLEQNHAAKASDKQQRDAYHEKF